MNYILRYFSKNRFGTTTIFLSIILSSLIFVEATYIIFVANLDRRLTYNRAVSIQVETYLSQYDRELFRIYGIYAFDQNKIDDSVFQEILSSNGLFENAILVVSGIDEFDTEDLRKAISTFYAYRSTSILIDYFREEISVLIDKLDQHGVREKISQFLNSTAEPIIKNLLSGVTKLSEYSTILSDSEYSESLSEFFGQFNYLIDQYAHARPDVEDSYDRGDLSFCIDTLDFLSDTFDQYSEFIDDYIFHPYCTHYAAYNFDSRLDDDKSINGTAFSSIHEGNHNDTEYILTGLEGRSANGLSALMIFQMLYIKNLVIGLTDPELSTLFQSIAEALSILVTAVSGGTVPLPEQVYLIVIVAIYSYYTSSFELNSVLRGEKVTFFTVEDVIDIEIDYRDFLFLFMNYVPDSFLLERMNNVINRDFESFVCGVSVTCERPLFSIEMERSYELYY